MDKHNFIITTDTNSDLDTDYIKKNNIGIVSLGFEIDNTTYDGFCPKISSQDFYNKMRSGLMSKSFRSNPAKMIDAFKKVLDKGLDILSISFSSALSGTYDSAVIAKKELEELYPDRKIVVIDSLCASLGQGLLVNSAVTLKKQGKSIDEIQDWIENNKLNLCHYFTVSDLEHLYRGGRVSKTSAFVGTFLHIKPILHVNDKGELIPSQKIRGRKKSLEQLANLMEQSYVKEKNDIVFISHGDCLEDAEYLRDLIKEKLGVENFYINSIGPAIGTHSGPDTIALFFYGKKREI